MAYSPSYDSTGVEYLNISAFDFRDGTNMDIRVAYRIYNRGHEGKTALIPTCYGGLINSTLNFTAPGQALAGWQVVVVAMLGNGESTSPSNTPGFPKHLYYHDCVSAQHRLTLGLKLHLDLVLGFSMGAQQAFHWATMFPTDVKNVIPICGSARTSGHNYSFLEGPKTALLNSADYATFDRQKFGTERKRPLKGLKAFGRAYNAWLTSGAWYRERQWEKALGFKTIEDYISAKEDDGFEHWDPEDLLALAWMWQHADVGNTLASAADQTMENSNGSIRALDQRAEDSYEEAMKSIKAKVLVMPCRTDQYFAWEDSESEVKSIGENAELAIIESVWGHVAGGGGSAADTEWMDRRIAKFLSK